MSLEDVPEELSRADIAEDVLSTRRSLMTHSTTPTRSLKGTKETGLSPARSLGSTKEHMSSPSRSQKGTKDGVSRSQSGTKEMDAHPTIVVSHHEEKQHGSRFSPKDGPGSRCSTKEI